MRKRIICKCGKNVTTNVLSRHLQSNRCSIDKQNKNFLIKLMDLKKTNGVAWRITEGLEAIADQFWYLSVWNGETQICEWTFHSPRIPGELRPSTLSKFSLERAGINNPSCNINFSFSKKEVISAANKYFLEIKENTNLPFSYVENELNKNFPKWRYLFADFEFVPKKERAFSKLNQLLAYFLNIKIEKLIDIKNARRGIFIKRGQNSSNQFKQIASEAGSKLYSRRRISTPQMILFEMIKMIDNDSILEYSVKIGNVYKSYDIFSPRLNAFIEMHGRVFHDIEKTNVGLKPLVIKNIKNDEIKQNFAQEQNFKYIVFWDDKASSWEEDIKNIFNINNLPNGGHYEECKNKVLSNKAKCSGL